ncbi:hypothetical protein C8R44DRAFT_881044 [Mycena epipterygia]|nr:hypothetical protein C8R44DRAFT_881044 [Mycena epipterygia]
MSPGTIRIFSRAEQHHIDVNKTFGLAPITFDKNANLVNQAVSCGANSLSM